MDFVSPHLKLNPVLFYSIRSMKNIISNISVVLWEIQLSVEVYYKGSLNYIRNHFLKEYFENSKNPIKKWAEKTHKQPKLYEKCSLLLIIREMQT